MSVFTRGPYGRPAVVLNTLSSINIEIIIIIIIIITIIIIIISSSSRSSSSSCSSSSSSSSSSNGPSTQKTRDWVPN